MKNSNQENQYEFNNKDINGQSLIHLINLFLPKESVIVEIGSWYAQTACMIAQQCHNVKKIYTVDPYKPFYNSFVQIGVDEKQMDFAKLLAKHNIYYSGQNNKIELIEQESLEFVKSIADESIDLIFLDAEVNSDLAYKDLFAWYPKIKNGGIFSGHDWQKLKHIVTDFNLKNNGSNISVSDDVWAWVK